MEARTGQCAPSGQMEDELAPLSASGSDSESAEDEESGYRERRTNRRGRAQQGTSVPGIMRTVTPGVAGARPGKKTRGRVKIKMEFINNKLRRYTTFSKRKTGIMKKVSSRMFRCRTLYKPVLLKHWIVCVCRRTNCRPSQVPKCSS